MWITILESGSQATVKDHINRTTRKRHKITINLQELDLIIHFFFYKSVGGGVFFKSTYFKTLGTVYSFTQITELRLLPGTKCYLSCFKIFSI